MNLTELCEAINGELRPDNDRYYENILGACGIENAGPGYITYAESVQYLQYAIENRPLAVITTNSIAQSSSDNSLVYIIVNKPRLSYVNTLKILNPKKPIIPGIAHSASISERAILDDFVLIGERVVIGERSTISKGTVIKAGSIIGDHVKIGNDCIIGENVVICDNSVLEDYVAVLPGAVIGSEGFGFERDEDEVPIRVPHDGYVILRTGSEIGANCVIARATSKDKWTEVGSYTKIDSLVQIAHNCKIGSCCHIAAQTGIAGSAIIGNFVDFAGQVGVNPKIKIGNHVKIGGQAGVFFDVEDKLAISGWPAQWHRDAMGKVNMINDLYKAWRDMKRNLPCITAAKIDNLRKKGEV
jgi:UDP-3-O-[3-hydroxymyristoyl] glucosamine N-acyltransferase